MTRVENRHAFAVAEPAERFAVAIDASMAVFVRGLAIEAEVGLYDHERGRTQPLVIDVEATLEAAQVAGLDDSLDYDAVAGAARALAAEGHVELVETFAQRLAAACLSHPTVTAVVVTVAKPEAVPGAVSAGVRVAAAKRRL